MLHVSFGCCSKSRVQLATLVDIYGEVGLGLDFFEHFIDCVLGKLELDWCQIYLSILDCSHNWPKTAILDTWHWLDNAKVLARVDVFGDWGPRRSVVLLVTKQNMIEKRAV